MPKGQGKRITCPDCKGIGWRMVPRGRIITLSTIGRVFHKRKAITMTRDSPEQCKLCKGTGWVSDRS